LTALRTRQNKNPVLVDAPSDAALQGIASLRFRLLLTVTIFLIPIALVSMIQGLARMRSEISHAHEHLVQSARMAASNEGNALATTQQIIQTLSNIDDVRNVTAQCDRTLSDALIGVHFLTNLSRVDRNGIVVCSALPRAKGIDASKIPPYPAARQTMAFAISGQIISPVTHKPVIAAMLPLRDKAGQFAGTVAAGVGTIWLDDILKTRNLPKGAVASVFDRSGVILATNNMDVAKALFSTVPRLETLAGGLESHRDSHADTWTFAAAPLLGNNIFVGFAMRESRLLAPTYLGMAADFTLPLLMIVLAWGGIWYATDRQVTQWIGYLRRIAAAYRGGHYRVRPALADAPAEFKLLGDAMMEMADGIEVRDRNLREAVAQKTLQIRETHHRVKNNLQVVMSLLSLQAAQSKDASVRMALSDAQARINALALIHRNLNQMEDQTKVDLEPLLGELVRQVVDAQGVDRSRIPITVDIPSLQVRGEIAVPLALFIVETLTNIFRHAFPDERPGAIVVRLQRREDGSYVLAIEDNGIGFTATSVKPGIGDRLMRVFGRQVGGTVTIDSKSERGTRVELTFAIAGENDVHVRAPAALATESKSAALS